MTPKQSMTPKRMRLEQTAPTDAAPPALVLRTFGPMFGVPDLSPFVVKAILLLKLSGLAFVERPSDPRRAPKGKLPVLEDGAMLVADSTVIRQHLEASRGVDFDAGLSPAERATGWMLERALEDNLYWLIRHERWLEDDNFDRGPRRFFDVAPKPLRPVIAALVRRRIRTSGEAHGIGRHSEAQRLRLAAGTLDAAATLLADTPYLFGDTPHGADATLFGFTVNLYRCDLQPKISALAGKHANLRAFTERMLARYFADDR